MTFEFDKFCFASFHKIIWFENVYMKYSEKNPHYKPKTRSNFVVLYVPYSHGNFGKGSLFYCVYKLVKKNVAFNIFTPCFSRKNMTYFQKT